MLKFTIEEGTGQHINFLDVHVDATGDKFVTSTYSKPTSNGIYLNARSECPQTYKDGTIKALHRNYKISSTWQLFRYSIEQLQQALMNNGYSNSRFESILKEYLNNKENLTTSKETTYRVYYLNQFSAAYKTDEKLLKQIIKNNTACKSNTKLQLIIYYKSKPVSNLIVRNNQSPQLPILKRNNLIYEFQCNEGDCELRNNSYIGYTTTTLSRRLTMHLAGGAPRHHCKTAHNKSITRDILVSNTKILKVESDVGRLEIMEALLIQQKNPELNKQDTGRIRTLKLHS